MSPSIYNQVLKIGCVSEQQALEWKENINSIAARGDVVGLFCMS